MNMINPSNRETKLGRTIVCTHCRRAYLTVPEWLSSQNDFTAFGCTGCGRLVPVERDGFVEGDNSKGGEILVGHSDEETTQLLMHTISEFGYLPVRAGTGDLAFLVFEERNPVAVVLGVGLTDCYTFELVEKIRCSRSDDVPIVIISSIFRAGSYKRGPTNLYGANVCIDEHLVPDFLKAILSILLSSGEDIRQLGQYKKTPQKDREKNSEFARARGIALKIVDHVVKKYFNEPAQVINKQLDNSRSLLRQFVSEEQLQLRDFVREAFDERVRANQQEHS